MSKQSLEQNSYVDKPQSSPLGQVIHLGIDAHLTRYTVVRQIDGATAQPAQHFSREELLKWIGKACKQAPRVVCCYEAGPFGYALQRQIEKLGAECLVVRPRNWDEYGQGVKTDSRDARALCEVLVRYVSGNRHALSRVQVPTVAQERHRAEGRARQMLAREVRRLGAWGRSQAMYHGAKLRGRWWQPRAWSACQEQLEAWLVSLLRPVRDLIVRLQVHIEQAEQKLAQHPCAAGPRPKGLGQLSHGLIAGEVLEWSRFKNRRQVASYTGLCPSEHSSGGKRRQGAINKHGNPRLRHVLVEAVWRLIQWQGRWVRWEKIRERFQRAKAPERKKLVVALARQLAIDLWRLHMGTATLEKLGLSPAT